MTPKTRAFLAAYLFAALGLWALLFRHAQPGFALPHALFYGVLTLNTYFSVRFYSEFTPASAFQFFIDAALVMAYGALAISIGSPMVFALCALAIFTIAPAKYAHMIGKTPFDKTLRRKILIDLLGTALCATAVALTVLQRQAAAAWLLAGLFSAANVYLLLINPMYRHVE